MLLSNELFAQQDIAKIKVDKENYNTTPCYLQFHCDGTYKLMPVKTLPFFPGGLDTLNKYLNSQIEKISSSTPTLYVQFLITNTGNTFDSKVSHRYNCEGRSTIEKKFDDMPKWSPIMNLDLDSGSVCCSAKIFINNNKITVEKIVFFRSCHGSSQARSGFCKREFIMKQKSNPSDGYYYLHDGYYNQYSYGFLHSF